MQTTNAAIEDRQGPVRTLDRNDPTEGLSNLYRVLWQKLGCGLVERGEIPPLLELKISAEQAEVVLREKMMSIYLTRLDGTPRPSVEAEHPGYFPESRAAMAEKSLVKAAPVEGMSLDEFLRTTEPLESGTFEDLWKRIQVTRILPLNGNGSRLPFGALRDTVLSLLPKTFPLQRPTLRSSIPHDEAEAKLATDRAKLREDLRAALGDEFVQLEGHLVPHSGVRSSPQRIFTLDSSIAHAVHRVESIGERVRRLFPDCFPRLEHAPGEAGEQLAQDLRDLPAFPFKTFEEWALTQGLDPEEADAVYTYLLQRRPRSLPVLERGLVQLLKMSKKPSFVLWEHKRPVDEASRAFLARWTQSDAALGSITFVATENPFEEMKQKVSLDFDRIKNGELRPAKRGWSEALRRCMKLGQSDDHTEALSVFEALVDQEWGGVAAFVDELKALAKAQEEGKTPKMDADMERKQSLILFLAPGLLSATRSALVRGLDARGQVPESALWGGEAAAALQLYLARGMTETGLPESDIFGKHLLYLNDLLLLVLTDFHYARQKTAALGNAYKRYGKIVGTSVPNVPPEFQLLPVHLYAGAKHALLTRQYAQVGAYVSPISDRDGFESYLKTLVARFRTLASDPQAHTLNWRPDGQGLQGFAPLQVDASEFAQELVRMGILALDRLLLEEPARAAEIETRRKELITQFQRMKGPLSPVQVMNFYLGETQRHRVRGEYAEAALSLDHGWSTLGEAEKGYHRRRLEHNEVELETDRLKLDLEGVTDSRSPEDIFQTALWAVIVEECLKDEELGESKHPMRVWEYQASFFQALLKFSHCAERFPELEVSPEDLTRERRSNTAFEFREFLEKPLPDWILESSRQSIGACMTLATQWPELALMAAQEILESIRNTVAVQASLKNLPLISEWEGLCTRLRSSPKKP